jgi:5-methylthioadenosine/S-adenosylhomocysteine deaminase
MTAVHRSVPAGDVSDVEMATQGSAVDSGRIEAGANADLVSHLADAVRESDVRHMVCDGQVLMCDREVQVFDEEAVRERAERAQALVHRAE